tara:strand:- start:1081 stop:1524 length:444 start_codon:yes stop_codon:yes gene_type:complete
MAGKKILTQFALPVGSTSGSFGNGTAGQVLTSGGASASMYWGTAGGSSGIGKVEKTVTWNYLAGNDDGVSFSGSDASGTATLTHNLNTQFVIVSAIDVDGHDTTAAGEQVDMGYNLIVKCPTVNTITLHWDSNAPSSSAEFKVTIIG